MRSDTIVWRCVIRTCQGVIHTDTVYCFLLDKVHNHEPHYDKFEKRKLFDKLKEKALSSKESIRDIVLNELTFNADSFVQTSVDLKYLKDSIKRPRNLNNYSFSEDSDIPKESQFLSYNEKFYLLDTGIKDENRVIILSSSCFLNILKTQQVWIVDGTFRTVPKNFNQQLVIQAKYNNINFSLMYCLMRKRNEDSYNTVFNFLKKENIFLMLDG